MVGKPGELRGWGEGKETKASRNESRSFLTWAELWDNTSVITVSNFSGYILSRLWCKQLNREQFLPWWRKQRVLKELLATESVSALDLVSALTASSGLQSHVSVLWAMKRCTALTCPGTQHSPAFLITLCSWGRLSGAQSSPGAPDSLLCSGCPDTFSSFSVQSTKGWVSGDSGSLDPFTRASIWQSQSIPERWNHLTGWLSRWLHCSCSCVDRWRVLPTDT